MSKAIDREVTKSIQTARQKLHDFGAGEAIRHLRSERARSRGIRKELERGLSRLDDEHTGILECMRGKPHD